MTVERAISLMSKAVYVGEKLKLESNIALAANDSKKLNYIKQEAIVLNKIVDAIACVTFINLINGEED